MAKERQTSQKLKILEALKLARNHPTAEEVYNNVKKQLPAISLATVYRNLNTMVDQGKITKLEVNKEFRFDWDTCHHQHLICKNCGKIMDVFQPEISEYALKKIKSKSFKPECVTVIFSGYCKDCSKKVKN